MLQGHLSMLSTKIADTVCKSEQDHASDAPTPMTSGPEGQVFFELVSPAKREQAATVSEQLAEVLGSPSPIGSPESTTLSPSSPTSVAQAAGSAMRLGFSPAHASPLPPTSAAPTAATRAAARSTSAVVSPQATQPHLSPMGARVTAPAPAPVSPPAAGLTAGFVQQRQESSPSLGAQVSVAVTASPKRQRRVARHSREVDYESRQQVVQRCVPLSRSLLSMLADLAACCADTSKASCCQHQHQHQH